MSKRDWYDAHLTNAAIDAHRDDPTFGHRPGDPLDAIAWFVEPVVSSSPRLVLPLLGNARPSGSADGRHRTQEHAIDGALMQLIERAIASGVVRADVCSTVIIVGAAAIASR